MQDDKQAKYINISIKYRVILLAICTAVYVAPVFGGENEIIKKLYIAGGMLVSCLLAIYLYRKIARQRENQIWVKTLFGIEAVTYGVFTFLSGGFSSPYFWYYMGYLITAMAIHNSIYFMIPSVIWCLSAALASAYFFPQAVMNIELNLVIGVIIIAGTFYVLLHYLDSVIKHRALYQELNITLQHEKERSERALNYATNLYDAINLFAMTNPAKVVEELGDTLKRTIAPDGCILVKFHPDGSIENQVNCNINAQQAGAILEAALAQLAAAEQDGNVLLWQELSDPEEGARFESVKIGKAFPLQGLFIRRKTAPEKTEIEEDMIYCGLTEMIFRYLDIQKQLEEYIIAEEQHRLADGIHDTVIQKLFGIACRLTLLEHDSKESDRSKLIHDIREIKQSAELTMKELREAIYGVDFDTVENSFHDKINAYMEEVEKLTASKIELIMDDDLALMTPAQKIALYRMSCEAVNNAVKHGRASWVQIEIRLQPDMIHASIKDNGTWREQMKINAHLQGRGLKNMYRMASMLGGEFIVDLRQTQGTVLRLTLPR